MNHDLSAGAGEQPIFQRSRDFYLLAEPQIKVLWWGKMWKWNGNACGVAKGGVSVRVLREADAKVELGMQEVYSGWEECYTYER